MFKKKSLKFTYAEIRRDARHAEALKARESSRFKRLSMIRSISDSVVLSESNYSMEAVEPEVKPTEFERTNERQPLSRLEKLFRWKQEKQLRKELEEKSKKKPFYVGKGAPDNKNLEVLKSSFINQSSLKLNSSRIVKSKLLAPSNSLQKNKVQNTPKQLTPSNTLHKKIQNTPKQFVPSNTLQQNGIKNVPKLITSNTRFQSSRIPNSKQIPKPMSNVSSATTSTFPKPGFNSVTSIKKPNYITKAVNEKVSIKNTPSDMKKTNNFVRPVKQPNSVAKAVNEKVSITKNTSSDMKKANNLARPVKQVSSASKFLPTQLNKPVKKIEATLSKPNSNATSLPVQKFQSKMPVSNVIQTFPNASKLHQKGANSSMKNEPAKKGYCFKKAVINSHQPQSDILKNAPKQGSIKKADEKKDIYIEKKKDVKLMFTKAESLTEMRQEDIPDVTFNSDISIIKPTSFAPPDFTFDPPEGLNDFSFGDDDPYQVLELVKQKFMSRTSTPNKSTERKSSPGNCKESVCNDSEKSLNNSSNNVQISLLMSPEVNPKNDNKCTYDEPVNQQICDVVSDVVTKIEITKEKRNNLLENLPCEDKSTSHSNQSEDVDEVSGDVSSKVHSCENQPNEPAKICNNRNVENDSMEDSLLDTIDLNKIRDLVEEKIELVKSSPENCKESVCNDSEKSLNNSSNNVQISLLMSPEVNPKSDNKCTYDEPVNQQICDVVSDVVTKIENTKEKRNNLLENLPCEDKSTSHSNQSEDVDEVSGDVSSKVHSCENQPNEPAKICNNRNVENDSMEDSLLDTIDLNKIRDLVEEKIELVKLEEEDDNEADTLDELELVKNTEKRSGGVIPKRVSILKNMSLLNSIAETSEIDDYSGVTTVKPTKESQISANTPRRSKRTLDRHCLDILVDVDSPHSGFSGTPRRSTRLQRKSTAKDVENNLLLSPFEEKKSIPLRRSMRLIDLNTPEKDENKKPFHSNLTQDFGKLNLNDTENMDPNMLLIDLDSPKITSKLPSKKVSLLYSPVKTRNSMRKSIKGDLMAFSPST